VRTIDAKRVEHHAIAHDVAAVWRGGGIVIFPTDTVYGIGCDPANETAVERIYAAKGRSRSKPLSLHFGSVFELQDYAPGNALVRLAAEAFLPGPLTLIVERPASIGAFVTGDLPTIGLRAPNHPLCSLLLAVGGPIAATSANPSGRPAYIGTGAVTELPAADVFVDDGPTPVGAESTVIDVTGTAPRLVREGAIGTAMLEMVYGRVEGAR